MSFQASPGEAACPVCGTPIIEEPRICAQCETPHHADCWDYVRRCAVYACNGTTARGARAGTTAPGASDAALAAPAVVVASSAVLAGSATCVLPIVPVHPRDARREVCWIADGTGAWVGARDELVTVAPAERVVMVPRLMARGLRSPEAWARTKSMGLQSLIALALSCVIGLPLMSVSVALGRLAFVGFWLWAVVSLLRSWPGKPPERAWLVRNTKGLWLHAVSEGRPWELLVEEPVARLSVRLVRSYEDGEDDASRTLLTYRLVMEWSADPVRGDRKLQTHQLAPPLQMPETAAERRPVLEQLVARRALGQHIAALLGVPFEEGVRPT